MRHPEFYEDDAPDLSSLALVDAAVKMYEWLRTYVSEMGRSPHEVVLRKVGDSLYVEWEKGPEYWAASLIASESMWYEQPDNRPEAYSGKAEVCIGVPDDWYCESVWGDDLQFIPVGS